MEFQKQHYMFLAHSSHSVKDEQIHEMSFFSARFKNFVFSYEVHGNRSLNSMYFTLQISLGDVKGTPMLT